MAFRLSYLGCPNSVLESLAPTYCNTPAWTFLVCLVRPWLARFRCV